MNFPKNISDLEMMIEQGIEESLTLEYKSSDALQSNDKKKKEIAKDVSSMANSAGGVIIYGVKEFDEKEKKHLPEKITPINRKDFSKEQLEHTIQSNISPRIEGLIIHPISLEDPEEVVYVVEIPQSTTAHQNLKDYRYYKRYNFEAVPMSDYEIKDIMNRSKHPVVDLEFEVESRYNEWMQGYGEPDYYLIVYARNKGTSLAEYVNYFLWIPRNVVDDDKIEINNKFSDEVEICGDNTFRDKIREISRVFSPVYEYGPSRFDPILPGLRGGYKAIKLQEGIDFDEIEITWKVHADNAVPVEGKVFLGDFFKK